MQEAGQESPKKPEALKAHLDTSDGPGDDFFDSISCEAIERLELSEGQNMRMRPSEQRKVSNPMADTCVACNFNSCQVKWVCSFL